MNHKVFVQRSDSIFLVYDTMSAKDMKDVRELSEWARHCASSKEFLLKANQLNFSNDSKRGALNLIRRITSETAERDINDDELWEFTKHLNFCAQDLDREGTPEHISYLTEIGNALALNEIPGEPQEIWATLVNICSKLNQNAATVTLKSLEQDLGSRLNLLFKRTRDCQLSAPLSGLEGRTESAVYRQQLGRIELALGELREYIKQEIDVVKSSLRSLDGISEIEGNKDGGLSDLSQNCTSSVIEEIVDGSRAQVEVLSPQISPRSLTANYRAATLHEHLLAFLNANNANGFREEEAFDTKTVAGFLLDFADHESATEKYLKRRAKLLKRMAEGAFKHSDCLEILATLFGYSNWHDAQKNLNSLGTLPNRRKANGAQKKLFNAY